MLFRRNDPQQYGSVEEERELLTPEEESALQAQLTVVEEEKRRALLDPGPSWHDWFLFDASKWWVGLGLFVVDVWIVTTWLALGSFVGMALSLVGAVYAEYLLAQYLWYRPTGRSTRDTGRFGRSWHHPFEYGRWTPDAVLAKTTADRRPPEGTPDPREFL